MAGAKPRSAARGDIVGSEHGKDVDGGVRSTRLVDAAVEGGMSTLAFHFLLPASESTDLVISLSTNKAQEHLPVQKVYHSQDRSACRVASLEALRAAAVAWRLLGALHAGGVEDR